MAESGHKKIQNRFTSYVDTEVKEKWNGIKFNSLTIVRSLGQSYLIYEKEKKKHRVRARAVAQKLYG